MKRLLFASLIVLANVGLTFACDKDSEKAPSKAVLIEEDTRTKEEIEFLADDNSPKMYTMKDAKLVGKIKNLPVACWQGKNMFADPRARRLAMLLKDKAIMAAMDSYEPYPDVDQFGPKLLLDTSDYLPNGKTVFIRVESFKFAGQDGVLEESSTYNDVVKILDRYNTNPQVKTWEASKAIK